MKKTALKKKSQEPIKKLQEKIWKLCRELVYLRDKNIDGTINCFTCGATNLEGSNKQLGHFIPDSTCGAFLRYDLRNLQYQCMRCNIHGGGQGAEYYRNMVNKHGQKYVDQIFKDKQKIVKACDHYIMIYEEYNKKLEELKNHN